MMLADADSVVRVHLCAFAGFFLSSLGPLFLREFYKAALQDKSGIALVSTVADVVSGFAVGTTEPRGFYRRIIVNNWYRFSVASFVPVLKQPQTIFHIFRRLLATAQSDYVENETLLISIAVHPSNQRQGIGGQLMECFSGEAERRGTLCISLTTDRLNNSRTNRFYVQAGFSCARSFETTEQRQMNEYRKYF